MRSIYRTLLLVLGLLAAPAFLGVGPSSQSAWGQSNATNPYTDEAQFDSRYDAIAALRNRGQYQEAMQEVEQLVADLKAIREIGPNNPEGESRWLVTRALQANLLRDAQRNDESIELHEELLQATSDDHSLAIRMLHLELMQNYGLVLANSGRRSDAFEQLRKAVAGYRELEQVNPDNQDVILKAGVASSNLGTLLVRTGQLREAVEVFDAAIASSRKLTDDRENRDRKLATLLLNQSVALSYLGDHLQARERIEESVELRKKIGEGDSKEAIRALITLGAILGRLNQYGESDQTYEQAISKLRVLYPESEYPDGTPDLAIAIDNRGVSLSRMGEYELAAEQATEANQMFAALAKKSPGLRLNYARSSATLALLNARLMRHEIARKNLSAAIQVYESMFPDGHFEIPGLYRSQAIIESESRLESESLASIETGLQLGRQQFPEEEFPNGHWVVAQTLDTAGTVALAAGRPELAADYFIQAVEMQNRIAAEVLQYVSEAEALQFLAIADKFKSHLLSVPTDTARVYSLLASEKARILDQQQARFALARSSRDLEVANLMRQYEQVRTALARAILRSASAAPDQANQLAELQQTREQLERRIAEAGRQSDASAPLAAKAQTPVTAERVLESLDEQSAVVEFFSYERHSVEDQAEIRKTQGSQQLAAFVLDGANRQIQRIEFGKVLPLRSDVRRLVAAMQFGTEQEPIETISQQVCPPLLDALPDTCQQLAIIPDGIVGAIPFGCLLDPSNQQPLVRRFEFRWCSSLNAALRQPPMLSPSARVLAVGDLDYGPIDPDSPLSFVPLPGSADELTNLRQHFEDGEVTILRGKDVDDQQLLDQLPLGEIIHLATHGYVTDFARRAVTNNSLDTGAIRQTADQRSPLLAARLALSGANAASNENILTGEQFASLDLRNNQLVVLSACESGVGERVLGEGIFGLQRAFHVAGASHVVATLWPVSDREAVVFMDHFYSELLEHRQSPAAALRAAQLAMIADTDLPTDPTSPSAAIANSESGAEPPDRSVRRGIRFNIPDDSKVDSEPTEAALSTPDADKTKSTGRSTWAAFFLSVD